MVHALLWPKRGVPNEGIKPTSGTGEPGENSSGNARLKGRDPRRTCTSSAQSREAKKRLVCGTAGWIKARDPDGGPAAKARTLGSMCAVPVCGQGRLCAQQMK